MVNVIELAKENCPYHSEEMRGAYYDGFVRAAALVRAEALAEPELNLNCKSVQARLATVWGYVKAEAVKQEPIAWACIDADGSFMDALDRKHGAYQTPLYAAPVQPVKQEPYAYEFDLVLEGVDKVGYPILTKDAASIARMRENPNFSIKPLYAAPVSAKREWVELTDYEIGAVMDFGYATDSELENARDVIAAFKEKNNV